MPTTKFISPWIHQLNRKRPVISVDREIEADVAIVGAGISGVMSAYFLLTQTKRNVLIIDAGRAAHGATGHNAGQLVSYFERPFYDIVEEFGLEMAAAGQHDVETAWDLLASVIKKEKLETPCHLFMGHAGFVDMGELLHHLKNNVCKKKAGLVREKILVSKGWKEHRKIPAMYRSLYSLVDHAKILDLLQTKDASYVAMLSGKKGVMNSAAFCEELIVKMLARFSDRFKIVENLPIANVRLLDERAELLAESCRITANRVVLCTNGFERMKIQNHGRGDIDTKFHHLVRGSVGYMAAFFETPARPPVAISYLPPQAAQGSGAYDTDPYYYLTRRPYEAQGKSDGDLVCVGGPESLMDDTDGYRHEHPYLEEARGMIEKFLKRTYPFPRKKLSYEFLWHGLMGYTPNGLRCVGVEPCNPVLLYNLGCNGVGILPSIFGGRRIARLLNGEELVPSIFDPQDKRCELPERSAVSTEAHSILRIVAWMLLVALAVSAFVSVAWR